MPLEKQTVVDAILNKLDSDLALAIAAAERARDTATDKENIAENKYDTLGLEAAYLAHGQSNRAQRLADEKQAFAALPMDLNLQVKLGSLVAMENEHGLLKWVFVGPGAAGLTLKFSGKEVVVVTPDSPLGAAIWGLSQGEVASINGAEFELVDIL